MLALSLHRSGQYFVSGEEAQQKHSLALGVCNKEQPLRSGSHREKGEPKCLSRVRRGSVRDPVQGGSVERFERDKCSLKVKLFGSSRTSGAAADFLSNPAAPLR